MSEYLTLYSQESIEILFHLMMIHVFLVVELQSKGHRGYLQQSNRIYTTIATFTTQNSDAW